MGDSQKMDVGDNSKATQVMTTGAVVVVPSDAIEKLVRDLFERNFPQLLDEARTLVAKRIEEFVETFAAEMREAAARIDPERLADPLFQSRLCVAIRGVAERGQASSPNALSRLLCVLASRGSAETIVLTAALSVDVAATLARKHIDYLALHALVEHVAPDDLSVEDLDAACGAAFERFPGATECTMTDLKYMAAVGAVGLSLRMVGSRAPTYLSKAAELNPSNLGAFVKNCEQRGLRHMLRIVSFRNKCCLGVGATTTAPGQLIGWMQLIEDRTFDWAKFFADRPLDRDGQP